MLVDPVRIVGVRVGGWVAGWIDGDALGDRKELIAQRRNHSTRSLLGGLALVETHRQDDVQPSQERPTAHTFIRRMELQILVLIALDFYSTKKTWPQL